jgi:hypothetical protein
VRRVFVNLVAVGALLVIPAAAAAQQAPPPDSELDQYIPSFPGAKGDKELGGGGNGDGDEGRQAGADPVPAATEEELRSLGPAGGAAADFAVGSAPRAGNGGKGGEADGSGGKAGGKGGGADGRSSVGAVAGALGGDTSDGGIGVLLPLLLGAIAVGGILYVLRRRGIIGSSGGNEGGGA